MHKKSASDRSSVSTSSLTSRKNSCRLSDSNHKSDQSTISNPSMTARKCVSASKAEKNNSLTSIIEEKVSNLKTKFDELSGLRRKLAESNTPNDSSPILNSIQKPRMKTISSYKNPGILTGSIFKTDDKRFKGYEAHASSPENSRFSYNPSFERSTQDNFPSNLDKPAKFEIEHLRLKLKNKEKELQEIEKAKQVQQSLIAKKETELKECEEKYKVLLEINKSLKLQVNRLEAQMKNLDDKKSTNVNAIKNLSYIILSKDSPSKDQSREFKENKTDQGLVVKYIETLNQLQNIDSIVLKASENLKNNQNREALRVLMNVEKQVAERIVTTKECIEELESLVYECKSPLLSKIEKNQSPVREVKKEILTNDFYCFMKCQASLLEELLIVC